jgi:hypothetical protein
MASDKRKMVIKAATGKQGNELKWLLLSARQLLHRRTEASSNVSEYQEPRRGTSCFVRGENLLGGTH